MLKEFKYLFFLFFIFFFLFFSLRYYFSDENHKKSYRSIDIMDNRITNYEKELVLLKNNTENIIESVEYNKDTKSKKHTFWKLLYNDW